MHDALRGERDRLTRSKTTMDTTNRDAYLLDILDVYGPNAVRLVAERIADECADDATDDIDDARTAVAGFVIDLERGYIAKRDPDYWYGVTTEEAHEIRASIICDVAEALVDIANAAADEAYERRMSCRRPTNDCGCRTCGG